MASSQDLDLVFPGYQEDTENFNDIIFNFEGHDDLFETADSDLDIKIPMSNEPVAQVGPPPRGDFCGQYRFEVNLSGETTNRKKYMYSHVLNRVFLCMMAEMAVQFSWDWDALNDRKLWVRATTILARSEQQEARVRRCYNHREPSDVSNRDVPEHVIPHVLRSVRQGPDVVYCGADQDTNSWFSVALEAPVRPPSGVQVLQHIYLFTCKHSCISGINRRPIEVLFTLEDSQGEVLGRRSLGVRVCSCPRRDMEKEEAELRPSPGGPPPRKKAMLQAPPPPQHPPGSQVVQSSQEDWLRAVHSFGVVAMSKLPPDNPASPILLSLTEEIKRQIDQLPN